MTNRNARGLWTLTILGVTVLAGCKTPCWNAFRSMGCVSGVTDSSANDYWTNCKNASTSASNETFVNPKSTALNSNPTSYDYASSETEDSTNIDSPIRTNIQLAGFRKGPLTDPADDDSAQQKELSSKEPPRIKAQLDSDPLRLPPELPGADTPPLVAPKSRKIDSPEYRDEIKRLFPEISELKMDPNAMPDESLGVLGLEELHQIARENHPGLRAASAAVESARGLMIQAGLPPNPNIGYEGDTIRTLNTPGYHGAYFQQTFITARKLGLAAEAAAVDYANASISLRKTWVTVNANVRQAYFQVLASRQRVTLAKALFQLSERAYQAQVRLVAVGEAAPYEPLQLRVLTMQARASLIRAQTDSVAAWRVLAAATGVPNMPHSALAGRIDCPVPDVQYDDAVARMSEVHTDLQIAQNAIRKQQTLVTLADRTNIPDLNVGFVLQHDNTFTPGTTTYNLMLGGAVPVWNKNEGNRISARAELVKASQNVFDTRNTLVSQLAGSYGVYQANRQLAAEFKTDALRDQVRAYRGIYQRYLADPNGISFNDVIVAQQTVASVLNQYLDILQQQWKSTVDLGELLQVDDLFQMGPPSAVAEIPAIETQPPK